MNKNMDTGNGMWLYVIRLKESKFYVGTTTKPPEERLSEHEKGRGSMWTKKYEPMGFQEKYLLTANSDEGRLHEDFMVKKYMLKHGVDNVRGGSYSSIVLPEWRLKSLYTELFHAKNRCMKCGDEGHWSSKCRSTTDVLGNAMEIDTK